MFNVPPPSAAPPYHHQVLPHNNHGGGDPQYFQPNSQISHNDQVDMTRKFRPPRPDINFSLTASPLEARHPPSFVSYPPPPPPVYPRYPVSAPPSFLPYTPYHLPPPVVNLVRYPHQQPVHTYSQLPPSLTPGLEYGGGQGQGGDRDRSPLWRNVDQFSDVRRDNGLENQTVRDRMRRPQTSSDRSCLYRRKSEEVAREVKRMDRERVKTENIPLAYKIMDVSSTFGGTGVEQCNNTVSDSIAKANIGPLEEYKGRKNLALEADSQSQTVTRTSRSGGRDQGLPIRNSWVRDQNVQGIRRLALSDRQVPFKNNTNKQLQLGRYKEKDHKKYSLEELVEKEITTWTISRQSKQYYCKDGDNPKIRRATEKSLLLQVNLKKTLRDRRNERESFPIDHQPLYFPQQFNHMSSASSSDSEEDDASSASSKSGSMEWLKFGNKLSNRAHSDMCPNIPGELNTGPMCKCSKKDQSSGFQHGKYMAETAIPKLEENCNNYDKLYHYKVVISPRTNVVNDHPTVIKLGGEQFEFEGFSMITTERIPDIPVCKVVRYDIEYNIAYVEDKMPKNFTLSQLELFHKYVFHDLLELWDWSTGGLFYFMPKFVRPVPGNGREILSMSDVIDYLLKSYKPLVEDMELYSISNMSPTEWERSVESVVGMLVTNPAHRPSTHRLDHLARVLDNKEIIKHPNIIHYGVRPSQLSAQFKEYHKTLNQLGKLRHLLANKAKPTEKDKIDLKAKELYLEEVKANVKFEGNCRMVLSSQGYFKTGIMTDMVENSLFLPALVDHIRVHRSLRQLETRIDYKFKSRHLLQQAVTHPSLGRNLGTNPDHIGNTSVNCGVRQPQLGEHYLNQKKSEKKKGINVLVDIMSKFGQKTETESKVEHNERLEFLGDAVVQFITTVHLFFMFPDIEEGGLTTYRNALVENPHLAKLAALIGLDNYIRIDHDQCFCQDKSHMHAMANCFEALIGAIFLDGGVDVADRVFGDAMFGTEPGLWETWKELPLHPLQRQEPLGDRHWIQEFSVLRKLVEFEELTGIQFGHIRLLARAFTDRAVVYNDLTLGTNQRLELLGDAVLHLTTSEFVYKHFPDHHEGHLSLLRASLVNYRTQAVVFEELCMSSYAIYAKPKDGELKLKDKADVLEAFLGALYVDKDLQWCQVFAQVCFFSRLEQIIVDQEWNDPKSRLQQCCITLRSLGEKDPDLPVYKVVESKGPSDTIVYTVAVYFRGERLATGKGHSVRQAEFNAAKTALETCDFLFPHLDNQKRILKRSFAKQNVKYETSDTIKHEVVKGVNVSFEDCSLEGRKYLSVEIRDKIKMKLNESKKRNDEDVEDGEVIEESYDDESWSSKKVPAILSNYDNYLSVGTSEELLVSTDDSDVEGSSKYDENMKW